MIIVDRQRSTKLLIAVSSFGESLHLNLQRFRWRLLFKPIYPVIEQVPTRRWVYEAEKQRD